MLRCSGLYFLDHTLHLIKIFWKTQTMFNRNCTFSCLRPQIWDCTVCLIEFFQILPLWLVKNIKNKNRKKRRVVYPKNPGRVPFLHNFFFLLIFNLWSSIFTKFMPLCFIERVPLAVQDLRFEIVLRLIDIFWKKIGPVCLIE